MRRTLSLVPLLSLVLVLAACSPAADPGWTFAPVTPSPVATGDPAGSPAASPAGPTEVPTATSETPEGTITLTSVNIQWVEKELTAPADQPFVIRLVNQDAGVPHNVEIKQNGQTVYKGDIFNGVETRDFEIPALAAGTYEYICTVHPNMVGTLTVGG
jgi:hypothetical protein